MLIANHIFWFLSEILKYEYNGKTYSKTNWNYHFLSILIIFGAKILKSAIKISFEI